MIKKAPHLILILIFSLLSIACETSENFYLNRGNYALSKKRYEWALDCYNAALKYNPQSAEAYFGRGNVWLLKKKYNFAIIEYTKAIELNPDYQDAYLNRANAWKGENNLDNALSDCNKGIEINSTYDEAYLLRADIWMRKGDFGNVKSDLMHAINLKPENPISNNMYAWFLATCPDGKYRDGLKAIQYAEKVVHLDPDPYWMDTLAAAYAEVGNFEKAVKILEETISILEKRDKDTRNLKEHLKYFRQSRPWRHKPGIDD